MLARVVSLLTGRSTEAASTIDYRAQLRDAHAALRQRTADHAAAKAAADRVRKIVDAVYDAEAEATAAKRAAELAAQLWVAAGADSAAAQERDRLFAEAQAARVRADQATVTAAGAKKALPALDAAVSDATLAVKWARDAIAEAATALVINECEPLLAAHEKARAEYLATLVPLVALREVFQSRGPAHPLYGFANNTAIQFKQRFAELALPKIEPAGLQIESGEWLRYLRRLVEDPDASFDEPQGIKVVHG